MDESSNDEQTMRKLSGDQTPGRKLHDRLFDPGSKTGIIPGKHFRNFCCGTGRTAHVFICDGDISQRLGDREKDDGITVQAFGLGGLTSRVQLH